MHDLRASAVVLTFLVTLAGAQEPAANPPAAATHTYTNRIQFHDVDLGLDDPKEQPGQEGSQRDESYDPLTDPSVSQPMYVPTQRGEQMPRKRVTDKAKAKEKEKKESGWGWLADDVKAAEKKAEKKSQSDNATDERHETKDSGEETTDEDSDEDTAENEERPRQDPTGPRYFDAFYAPDFAPRAAGQPAAQVQDEAGRPGGEVSAPASDAKPAELAIPEESASWLQASDETGSEPAAAEPSHLFEATKFAPALESPTMLPGESAGFQPLMPSAGTDFEIRDSGSSLGGGFEPAGGFSPGMEGDSFRVESSGSFESDQPSALPW